MKGTEWQCGECRSSLRAVDANYECFGKKIGHSVLNDFIWDFLSLDTIIQVDI